MIDQLAVYPAQGAPTIIGRFRFPSSIIYSSTESAHTYFVVLCGLGVSTICLWLGGFPLKVPQKIALECLAKKWCDPYLHFHRQNLHPCWYYSMFSDRVCLCLLLQPRLRLKPFFSSFYRCSSTLNRPHDKQVDLSLSLLSLWVPMFDLYPMSQCKSDASEQITGPTANQIWLAGHSRSPKIPELNGWHYIG